MKLPSQNEASLPIGKIILGVTAVVTAAVLGLNGYASQVNEKKAEGFFASAQDHVRLEQEPEALNAINHALDLKEKPEYLEVKANILMNQNKVYEADKLLQKLIVHRPKDAHARYLLSTMALNEDALDQAVKWMQEAKDLEPQNLDYSVDLANLWYRQGHVEKARALYEAVIQQDPNNWHGWEQYATAFSNDARYKEAIAIEQRAIQQFPKNFAPYFLLASTYDNMGNRAKAAESYRKSLELYPVPNSVAAKRIFEITGKHVPVHLEKMVADDILYTSKGNVMYVTATVNGKPGRFLIDTGASVCVLYQRSVNPYHVNPTPHKIAVQTGNGVIQLPLAYGNLQVGNSEASKVTFGIAPNPQSPDSDGIIGMNYLNQFQMSIDKDTHTITLAHEG